MTHRLMTTRLVLIASLCLLAASAVADTTDNHSAVSLQLFHPIATPSDPATSASVRLSLFYARSHSISAFDLNGGVAINSGDTRGLQLTGLYNQVGGRFQGLGLTGAVQHLRRSGSGILLTAGANHIEGSFNGFQVAGLLNHTAAGFSGGQISGFANLNDGAGSFLQLASIANVNSGPFGGFQLSIFMNASMSVSSGAQLALVNFADVMHGFQIGAVNLSRIYNGVQVGVLNYSKTNNGTPIGLVNLSNDSRREWLFSANTLSLANVGFRSVLNGWTSVVSVGMGDQKGDVKESYFLSWHYGRQFLTRDKWALSLDLGFVHIIPTASDDPLDNDSLHYALEARLLGDWHLNDNIGFFAAAGLSSVYDHYSSNAPNQTDALFSGGIVLK